MHRPRVRQLRRGPQRPLPPHSPALPPPPPLARWPWHALPLATGGAPATTPAHPRGAVTARPPHCAFPGGAQPASVCDVHHIIPRSRGGPTALPNLVPLCGFHHLTVIHRW